MMVLVNLILALEMHEISLDHEKMKNARNVMPPLSRHHKNRVEIMHDQDC